MPFPLPEYSRSEVTKAGDVLRAGGGPFQQFQWAIDVLVNWRAAHAYPINTFQSTLRAKLRKGYGQPIVAQRLKRLPSIVAKLRRFPGMELARMQDIGGLRAVVPGLSHVRQLEAEYRTSSFEHELVGDRDYIANPKQDGYRGIHFVYRYDNPQAPQEYEGMRVELQFRTRMQHTWAMAVETIGTFLGQALKSSEGDKEWLDFFAMAGCAFAYLEGTTPVPGFEDLVEAEVFAEVDAMAERLNVRDRLQAFSVASDQISKVGRGSSYSLIVLDEEARRVRVDTFSRTELDAASEAYATVERRIQNGSRLQAVLVSTGSVESLRRAYPSYFLDTSEFLGQLETMRTVLTEGD